MGGFNFVLNKEIRHRRYMAKDTSIMLGENRRISQKTGHTMTKICKQFAR